MERIFHALSIFMKYDPDGCLFVDYNQIFACSVRPVDISLDDLKRLEDLKWRWDKTYCSWQTFV